MQRGSTKRILFNSFWLSVLLHLLFLLSFSVSVFFVKDDPPKPPQLMQSYLYTGAITPSSQKHHASAPTGSVSEDTQNTQNQPEAKKLTQPTAAESPPDRQGKLVIQKRAETTSTPQPSNESKNRVKKSLLAASMDVLEENQRNERNAQKDEEPIYLIGDVNTVADPIIKLLGRALTANFRYPAVAEELGASGRVLIGLTLHPEGYFSDVQIISSSNNRDLDAAALYAVNTAPTVVGADRFLSRPKHFVVGFLFRVE